jgi:hypothetical protein
MHRLRATLQFDGLQQLAKQAAIKRLNIDRRTSLPPGRRY